MWKRIAALAGTISLVGAASAKAQTSVCVEVEVRSWADLETTGSQTVHGAPEAERTQAEQAAIEQASVEQAAVEQASVEQAAVAEQAAEQARTGPEGEAQGAESPATEEQIDIDEDDDDTERGEEVSINELEPDPPERIASRRARAPRPRSPAFEPPLYLRRLIEYRITHMPGFAAVEEGCTQRLVVQFYPLQVGWTMFARYDGTSREEKVDRVHLDEFPALAARLTQALLMDQPLEETLGRRTVLRSDSEEEMRRVQGRTQVRISIGTQLIMGLLPTARSVDATAENVFRVSAPLSVEAGARTTYRAWALDGYLGMQIGTSRQAITGAGAGHADYTFGMTAALHFLRYAAADAVASFYGGGGASFQIHRYRILPGAEFGDDRGLVGGGLNLDLVVGYEVMRASALSFFVELQALLPAYGFDSENRNGAIRAWLPTAVVQIGLLR